MAIKDLMKAAKADRYTQDGRDKLNEALKADVQDRTYKTGEISEKTGLQKQPDGSWAPPKNGKAPGAREKKPTEKKRPKNIRWDRNNMQTMHEYAEYITPQQADNFYHQYGLDKTGEHKDRKGWLIKEYKNDDGDIYRAKYNQENKYIGYDFLPKGSAENPGDESKPAEPKLKAGVMNSKKAKAFKPELEEIRKADPSRFRENLIEVLSSWTDQNDGYLQNSALTNLMNLYNYERNQMYETGDSAPRILTGDTKIRVRK